MTALHMAARRGNVEIANVLIGRGATIDVQDKKGETPLRRAINCGRLELVELLMSRGANPLLPDKKGTTPVAMAVTKNILLDIGM